MTSKQLPERALSNHVLCHETEDKKKVTIILPAYLCFNFKKITEVDIASNSAYMSGALILGIYYKGLPDNIIDRIEGNLEVALNDEEFYSVSPNNPTNNQNSGKVHIVRNEDHHLINVTWRKQFPLELRC